MQRLLLIRPKLGSASSGKICLTLKQQEIPFDHPHSRNGFLKRFHATPGALQTFTVPVPIFCLIQLQQLATKEDGLDYLQVFEPRKLPRT